MPENLKNKNKQPSVHIYINIIFFIMLIFTLCLNFSNIIVLKNTDSSFIKSLGKNWQSPGLKQINFKGEKCEKNEVPIINDSWEGTNQGCFCNQNKNDNLNITNIPSILLGKCRSDLLSNKQCTNIPSIPQMPFKVWKGSYFCGQKTNLTYFDYEITETIEDCLNQDLMPCGKIDTENNILCIPKNSTCPYNFVNVLDSSQTNILKSQKDPGYLFKNYGNYLSNTNSTNRNFSSFLFKENQQKSGIISTNDKKSFYFTVINYYRNKINSQNKNKNNLKKKNLFEIPYIPFEFMVQSNLPCAYKGNEIFNSTNYPLSKNSKSPNCKPEFTNETYDNSFIELDSYEKSKIFAENNITSAINTLPGTKNYSINGDYKLFYRSYVGLKKKCFDSVKSNGKINLMISNFLQSENLINEIIRNLDFCLLVNILALVSELIILRYLIDKNYEISLMVMYVCFIVIYGITSIIAIVINNRKCWDLLLGVTDFVKPTCIDNLGYMSTKGFSQAINTTSFLITINLYLSLMMIVCEIYKFKIALNEWKRKNEDINTRNENEESLI